MNNSLFAAAVAVVFAFCTLAPTTFAHVFSQQRYNDGYDAGQNYAACDYSNCDGSNHGYDIECPNDKKHTYEFCHGYSLGYQSKWNSEASESTTQQQTQSQAQDGSSVHIDGSHNNVILAPRQNQEQ